LDARCYWDETDWFPVAELLPNISRRACRQIRPWVRFFARSLDGALVGFFVILIFAICVPYAGLDTLIKDPYDTKTLIFWGVIMFAWCFLEALFLSVFGATLGKALLRVSVRNIDGSLPDYGTALLRSLDVWARGNCCGIPIAGSIAQIVGYNTLTKEGNATWDRVRGLKVSHGEIGALRISLLIAVWLSGGAIIQYGVNVRKGAEWMIKSNVTLSDGTLLRRGADVRLVEFLIDERKNSKALVKVGWHPWTTVVPTWAIERKSPSVNTIQTAATSSPTPFSTPDAHLAVDQDGKRTPERGYVWLNPNDPKDLRVVPVTSVPPVETSVTSTPTPSPTPIPAAVEAQQFVTATCNDETATSVPSGCRILKGFAYKYVSEDSRDPDVVCVQYGKFKIYARRSSFQLPDSTQDKINTAFNYALSVYPNAFTKGQDGKYTFNMSTDLGKLAFKVYNDRQGAVSGRNADFVEKVVEEAAETLSTP
jgi:hypothetical protein